jgi:hypothetical protein
MNDLDQIYTAFRQIGEDPAQVLTPETPYLVAYGHEVLGLNTAPGIIMIPQRLKHGLRLRVTVLEHHQILSPVHLIVTRATALTLCWCRVGWASWISTTRLKLENARLLS